MVFPSSIHAECDVPVNSRHLCAKTSAIDDAALIAAQTLVEYRQGVGSCRLTTHHIVPHRAITERTSHTQTPGEIPTVRHAHRAAHVVVYAQYNKATYRPSFPSTPSV